MSDPAEHHEKKAPFPLTAVSREPTKSKDEIVVEFNEGWSEMRSGRAGRTIHCYTARNLTKGGEYNVELFEDDNANPFGFCDCVASVVCKHIKAALQDLLSERAPNFGEVLNWREEAAIDLTTEKETANEH